MHTHLQSKNWSPRGFHVMVKPCSYSCNLRCEYCYYLSKESLYPGSMLRMRDETLAIFTRQYIDSQQMPEVIFAWQGGEPLLMGIDFYKKALAYQREFNKKGLKIINTIQTNGILLDEAWCKFLKDNDFLTGLSLDGPEKLHNAYRKDAGGGSSFERVMHGLALLKENQVDFNVLTAVHAQNENHALEVYRFLRDEINAEFIQFIPIVEKDIESGFQEGYEVTPPSVSSMGFGRFLTTVFDEWLARDVGKVFIQHFDTALGNWLGSPGGACIFNPICGTALALEHNGDLYSCDHYVAPKYKLGNIHQVDLKSLISSQQQFGFGQAKQRDLSAVCLSCDVRFACHGGCPKNRIKLTGGDIDGLNYLCEGYKYFFRHINAPMLQMVSLIRKGLSPADIMKMV